ncbi:MAG: hypothetical protein QOH39_3140 [Verrucomicrobiota bacterium]|jgi:cyclophilin family peptidyl-prolyl cis-trans isomerase
MKSWWLVFLFAMTAGSHAIFGQGASDPMARFHTDLGEIDVELLQNVSPNTVANFLRYVNRGAYDNSFIHRSVPSFVIQGGGYKFANMQVVSIAQDPPVANEFGVSNTRGTLAMAKLANNPDSATNQWFFNESDSNAANLDTQNGGFTVFGRIINNSGLVAMDAINAVPIYNMGSPFDSIPLLNYTGGAVKQVNFVHVIWIKTFPLILAITHPAVHTIHLQGRGVANNTYKVQTSLTPSAGFTNLVSVTADSAGNISYNDTSPGTTKFYRLAIP